MPFAVPEIAEKEFQAGMKMAYPLIFGTNLPIKSVFGNAVIDENMFFLSSFFNVLVYVLVLISQNLVFIGYD